MTEAFERAIELFESGGPVMWPLLALSVLALALGLERLVFWLGANAPGRTSTLAELRAAWAKDDDSATPQQIKRVGPLYAGAVDALSRLGTRGAGEAIESVRRRAERFGGTLSFVITGAPLLGILGTVLGIIKSFEALGETGQEVQLPLIAAGIAQALITTAFGLIVALIALVPYALVRGRAQQALGETEALISARGGSL